jgi:ABC-type nitrate/sulfonate/bicarbonate transport system permease component
MQKINHLFRFSFVVLFWGLVWQIVSTHLISDETLFPSTFNIIKNSIFLIFINKNIIPHLLVSFERYSVALLIAAPIAILSAILVSGSSTFRWLFYPIIKITYPLPKVALFPFLLLIFGISDSVKIAMIFLGMYFLLFFSMYTGLTKTLNGQLGDIVKSYRISGYNYWFHFMFKCSLQYFFIGLQTALGYGLTLVVVSEMSLTKSGLGYFIWSAWDSFRILDLYSGLFVLAVIGYLINIICDYLILKKSY